MPASPPNSQRLGIIIPEVTEGYHRVEERELRRYDQWMAKYGFAAISTVEAYTSTDGWHEMESIYDTGSYDRLSTAAGELSRAGCDVVAWPCTCASFIGGLDWSRAQAEAMEAAAGRPVTSTSLAMLKAIRTLDADVVDVLGAYPAPVNLRFLRFLDDAGISVAAMVSLDCADELVSHLLDIHAEAVRFNGGLPPRSHLLLIPDTAIDTIALVPELEKELNRPVVAGNHATLWHSLRLLGHECHVPGAGTLFGNDLP